MMNDLRTLGLILFLTLFFLALGVAIIAPQHYKMMRQDEEVIARREAACGQLQAVYRKVAAAKSGSSLDGLPIAPEEVRAALARGTNSLGELSELSSDTEVFVGKQSVPPTADTFICFLLWKRDKVPIPYGLTATGKCRYAHPGEVIIPNFIDLGSVH